MTWGWWWKYHVRGGLAYVAIAPNEEYQLLLINVCINYFLIKSSERGFGEYRVLDDRLQGVRCGMLEALEMDWFGARLGLATRSNCKCWWEWMTPFSTMREKIGVRGFDMLRFTSTLEKKLVWGLRDATSTLVMDGMPQVLARCREVTLPKATGRNSASCCRQLSWDTSCLERVASLLAIFVLMAS